ncbi:MAG: PQQ-dependent sugar dehydrogenase [Chloroflexota bacterium]|nr:PQQ-dependent sugar dehydrogenase [Chloroflexota bacterium]
MPIPRLRPLIVGLVAVLVLGALLTTVVAARVRARARADWLQSGNLTLAPLARGFKEPTYVTAIPDDTGRLLVLEREGAVRLVGADGQVHPTPFIDLTGQVSTGGEEGLLGLAFHPRFQDNGYLYIAYTADDRSLQIVRYTASPASPEVLETGTASTVLSIAKQSKFHNGGMLAFGPDGYLYVSNGDDEFSDKAQELGNLFGKILRLDVDSAEPYAIPPTNPFVGRDGARGEIWSYGFRNPWRFSFDRATGDLWIADVGEARSEEVDFQPARSGGGENYGWPMNEGTECLEPERCQDASLVKPVVTYGHDMNCSVTGGYVYRGKEIGALIGTYVFGDLCTGGIFAVRGAPNQGATRVELSFSPIKISSFGEDASGELHVVDLQGGVVYRIAEASLP